MSNLLLKFRQKDSPLGVTRGTLKALAKEMKVSEEEVVHLALVRFANEALPAYEIDDGPLTEIDIKHIRQVAQPLLPNGQRLRKRSLF